MLQSALNVNPLNFCVHVNVSVILSCFILIVFCPFIFYFLVF